MRTFINTAMTATRLMTLNVLISLVVIGCAGGGGDSVAINDNQDPDPVVVDTQIAYIKRSFNTDPTSGAVSLQPDDLTDFNAFSSGSSIALRERASNTAAENDLTDRVLSLLLNDLNVSDPDNQLETNDISVDFAGIAASPTGEQIAFSARAGVSDGDGGFDVDDTTWNLIIYNIETDTLSFAIPNRLLREGEGSHPYHDIHPHFISGTEIVFASTRQKNIASKLLDDGRGDIYAALIDDRSEPGFQIHTLDLDNPSTDGIEQITHNVSHDVYPTLSADGTIIYTRFDDMTGNQTPGWNLYKVNPSGRGNTFLYGFNSHLSGSDESRIEFFKSAAMPNGDALIWLRPESALYKGGNFVTVNTTNFVENETGTIGNPDATGPAQTGITAFTIRTDDEVSLGGRYSAAIPLFDGTDRLLVSWSPCRLLQSDDPSNTIIIPCSIATEQQLSILEQASPSYGIWIFDPSSDTQLPVILADESFYYSDIVPLESKTFIASPIDVSGVQYDADLDNAELGQLFIDSVYDFSGVEDTELPLNGDNASSLSIAQRSNPAEASYLTRPARFIRLLSPVPLPDEDIRDIPRFAFSINGAQGMRDIIGYAPIMPDGSVAVTVPANKPFTFTILDENLRRISARHTVWLQLGSGERLFCVGCHSSDSTDYHGRLDSQPDSIIPGAQSLAAGVIGFPNTKTNAAQYTSAELLTGMSLGESMAKLFDSIKPVSNPSSPAFNNELEVAYNDLWSDTANGLPTDTSINYTYGQDIPFSLGEIPNQNSSGAPINRIVINYLDHIQPIWERDRQAIIDEAILDENTMPYTNCIGCHSSVDANGAARIPAAQLDLTATASDEDNDRVTSYRELLTNDDELWIDTDTTNIVTRAYECEREVDDGDGNLVTVIQIENAIISRVMRISGGANGSRFFECFEQANGGGICEVNRSIPGGVCTPTIPAGEVSVFRSPMDVITLDHQGLLSDGELRLISEWLDIGAQYYNDPYHPDLDD